MKTESTKSIRPVVRLVHKILFASMALAASASQVQAACNIVNLPAYDSPATTVRIQAEDYCSMVGVKTQTTMDVGGGLKLTGFDDGGSMTYRINVPDNIPLPATYSLTARYQVQTSGAWINSTGSYIATKSGPQDYVVSVDKGSANVNWFEFSAPPAMPTISVEGNQIFTRDASIPSDNLSLQGLTQLLTSKKIQRLVVPVEGDGGYLMDPLTQKARISAVVKAAAQSGQYLIINWNSSMAHQQQAAAMTFFEDMARQYGKLPYIIYELNDKPGANVSWADEIKPYANNVIQAIRAIDPDNLIIVGTPNQSQTVEMPVADPIIGKNIAYALSFNVAANSPFLKVKMNNDAHALRERVLTALESDVAFVITDWGFEPEQTIASNEYKEWSYFAKAAGIANVMTQGAAGIDLSAQVLPYFVSCFETTNSNPYGRHILARRTCNGLGNNAYYRLPGGQYNSPLVGSDRYITQEVIRVRVRSEKGGRLSIPQSGLNVAIINIAATGNKFQTFTSDVLITRDVNQHEYFQTVSSADPSMEIHWIQREEAVPMGTYAKIDSTTTKVVTNELGESRLNIQGWLPSACDELVGPLKLQAGLRPDYGFAVYSRPRQPQQVCAQVPVPFSVSVNVALDKPISVNESRLYTPPVASSSASSSGLLASSVASNIGSSSVSSVVSYSSSTASVVSLSSKSSVVSSSSKPSLVSSSSKSSAIKASSKSSANSSAPSINFSKIIEAEQYGSMSGVQTEVTKDVGGGRNVGYIDRGDWMSYSNIPVEIPATGQYEVEYRIASQKSGGSLDLEEAGSGAKLGSINFAATGDWQSWKSVKQSLTLSKGTHRFSLKATSGGWNINWFSLRKVN